MQPPETFRLASCMGSNDSQYYKLIAKKISSPFQMKKLFTIFIVLFFTASGRVLAKEKNETTSTSAQFGTITVHITGMTNLAGMFGVSLYNSKKGFPGKHEEAFASTLKKVTRTNDSVIFENIPYGNYAISIMHDENNNGKLDTNFLGIPKEGVGVSNNPKIGFGGPKFQNSVFILDRKELDVRIAMKYRIDS